MIAALLLALVAPLAVTSRAAAPAPVTSLSCAPNEGAGGGATAPRLMVKAAGGRRLFVCAVKAERHQGALQLTGFRVFAVSKAGKKSPKPIFESAEEGRPYRAAASGDELHFDELVWDGKENVAALETVVSCDTHACHAAKPPRCVFEKPKPGSRRALEQVGEYLHGAHQGKVPPKKLLDSLAALAYSGDDDARAFFRDRGSLSLDGEASDAYFDHQANLERLSKAGCL